MAKIKMPLTSTLRCYIQSLVIELTESDAIDQALTSLSIITQENSYPEYIRNFWLLYWAKISWKQDAENKKFYFEGFITKKGDQIIKNEAIKWLKTYSKKYFEPSIIETKIR